MRVRDSTLEPKQALFDQRLCEDADGVVVREINPYGKANLRYGYVQCVHMNELNDARSSKRRLSSRCSLAGSLLLL